MLEVPDCYWYCPECQSRIQEDNLRDLTYDVELLEYLRRGVVPEDGAAATRVQNAASFLKWQGDSLWLKK